MIDVKWKTAYSYGIGGLLLLLSPFLFAAGGADSHHVSVYWWLVVLLLLARLSSSIEKLGQPAVLGELLVGMLLGNLMLLNINIPLIEEIKHDDIIKFLAELGVVILLFQIGLESKIKDMGRVGFRAFAVAIIGVVAPFALGTYLIGPWLMPGLSQNVYLFLGAALTATSVGITGRVFKDLNQLERPEAQIVLGAAVIDDVIGLIILAVISAIATSGAVDATTVGLITAKAFGFLAASLALGWLAAYITGNLLPYFHAGAGMKFTLALSFCLLFAYLASLVELAPIVGAFAAGLILKPVHLKGFSDPAINDEIEEVEKQANEKEVKEKLKKIMDQHGEHHIPELIAPLGHFLVPLFFVMVGMQVNLATLGDVTILLVALTITIVAFLGKLVAGIVAGPVNKWIVGWGMVPRGEVGLIFAMIGKELGVIQDDVFSVIVIMVVFTTLVTPLVLNSLLRRSPA